MTERMTAAEYRRQTPKVGGRRVTPETAVKDMGKAWLTLHGWDHWPNTAGMGSEPGMPDRTAIRNGRVVFIEFKAPKGKLSANQEAFRDRVLRAGGEYIVVRDIRDLGVME